MTRLCFFFCLLLFTGCKKTLFGDADCAPKIEISRFNIARACQPEVNHSRLIQFVDEDHGFATALGKDLKRTTDGGETWQLLLLGDPIIHGLSFLNKDVGFVSTFSDVDASSQIPALLKTEDGGLSWESKRLSFGPLYELQFLDADTGLGLYRFVNFGGNFSLVRTTDAGDNWEETGLIFSQSSAPKLYFFDEQLGFVGDINGKLFKTSDGGVNWDSLEVGFDTRIVDIYFLDEETGFVLSESNLARTTNGGEDWQVTTISEEFNIRSLFVHFSDEKRGFLAAKHEDFQSDVTVCIETLFFSTRDGGETWFVDSVVNDVCDWLKSAYARDHIYILGEEYFYRVNGR